MRQAYVDRLVDYTLAEPGAETGGPSPLRVAVIPPGAAHYDYVWIDLPRPSYLAYLLLHPPTTSPRSSG